MIRIAGVDITFNKGTALESCALSGIDLTVPSGQFVTVIGSNGAGKSTLLNIIAGELVPDHGQVLVDDQDVTSWPVYRRSAVLARLFQDPRAGICENMSILENIAIACARTSPKKAGRAITSDLRALAISRLTELGLGLEKRLDDRVVLMSGGQRQALCLVMATLGPTKVLLLDEHTAALDPGAADLVMRLTDQIVRASKITSIMVTHSMRQALEHGSRTVMLHQGRIILDISGAERAAMSIEDLVRLFRRREGVDLADDQLLLT
jgi:putative tryptophan/tyrosine transport system ATP-binding protein